MPDAGCQDAPPSSEISTPATAPSASAAVPRTVTRRPTYPPFLLHVASKRAPWRLLLLPFVFLSLLAYAAKVIDRAKLKEINHRLLLAGQGPVAVASWLRALVPVAAKARVKHWEQHSQRGTQAATVLRALRDRLGG